MIIIATIVLVGAACCYGLSRRLSWGGAPEELDEAARRAVKDAQEAHKDRTQYGGSYGSI